METWQRYYTMWITPFVTLNCALSRKSHARQALFLPFYLSAFLYIGMYSYFIGGFFGAFTPYISKLETASNAIRFLNKELITGDILPMFIKSLLRNMPQAQIYLDRSKP